MSYTTKEKNSAIILIGEYGSANISKELYEDLEKFNLINIIRKDGIPTGARLTYSGNETFRKLKKTDEYLALTTKDFLRLFNSITFKFRRLYHINKYPFYYVSFNNNGSETRFTMNKTGEYEWRIQSTTLPPWVQEMEMEFSAAIADNEELK